MPAKRLETTIQGGHYRPSDPRLVEEVLPPRHETPVCSTLSWGQVTHDEKSEGMS